MAHNLVSDRNHIRYQFPPTRDGAMNFVMGPPLGNCSNFDPMPIAAISIDNGPQPNGNEQKAYCKLVDAFGPGINQDVTRGLMNNEDFPETYHNDRTWYWFEGAGHTVFLLTTDEQVVYVQLAFGNL